MKVNEGYFKPWIPDEEPRPPQGWGLSVLHSDNHVLSCDSCNKQLRLRDQYVYRFTTAGPVIYHNTKECCARIIN